MAAKLVTDGRGGVGGRLFVGAGWVMLVGQAASTGSAARWMPSWQWVGGRLCWRQGGWLMLVVGGIGRSQKQGRQAWQETHGRWQAVATASRATPTCPPTHLVVIRHQRPQLGVQPLPEAGAPRRAACEHSDRGKGEGGGEARACEWGAPQQGSAPQEQPYASTAGSQIEVKTL